MKKSNRLSNFIIKKAYFWHKEFKVPCLYEKECIIIYYCVFDGKWICFLSADRANTSAESDVCHIDQGLTRMDDIPDLCGMSW